MKRVHSETKAEAQRLLTETSEGGWHDAPAKVCYSCYQVNYQAARVCCGCFREFYSSKAKK